MNSAAALTILTAVGEHDGDGDSHARLLISFAVYHIQLHVIPLGTIADTGEERERKPPKNQRGTGAREGAREKRGGGDLRCIVCTTSIGPTNKTAAAKACYENICTAYFILGTTLCPGI